nr:dTDP-4-dehydrorhamnose reductase [uncultured Allomuricauda sp.]
MVKILVTGSSGQLGKSIQHIVHDFPALYFDFKSSQELDITKSKELVEAFQKKSYDFCINCAAYTNVEQAEKQPKAAYKVNAEGVKNLAEVCKSQGATLVHISTDYVFDGDKNGPYTTKDHPNPINQYGKSKLMGEQLIQEIWDNHYIIRTSWLYNKNHGQNFYRTVLNRALAGDDLHITDAQKGCPTNTDSLAKFILKEIVLGKKPFGLYHFTDGKPMTWYEFARQILEENGLTDKVKLVLDTNYRTFAKRPTNSVLAN